MRPFARAAVLIIGLLALAAPGMALAEPGEVVVISPVPSGQAPQLTREQGEFLDLVLPTSWVADAGSVPPGRPWSTREPVLIEEDMRMSVRKTFLHRLVRADFFPMHSWPRVDGVVVATEWQIHVYGQAIATLEAGHALSVAAQEAVDAADREEFTATALLTADLGLSRGQGPGASSQLAQALVGLIPWALLTLGGLGLLRLGLRRRLRVRAS